MKRTVVLVALMLAAWPKPAGAHRLDEYLQATRVSLEMDRVVLDIDLTPGVSVAESLVAAIDIDGTRKVSAAEGDAYARQVLQSVSLAVDGHVTPLTLLSAEVPAIPDMLGGTGVVRLAFAAPIRTASAGRHQLSYRNDHRADIGAYLANTLVPSDSRIRVVGQRRDRSQHELNVDYEVTTREPRIRGAWLLAGVTVVAILAVARRVGRPRLSY